MIVTQHFSFALNPNFWEFRFEIQSHVILYDCDSIFYFCTESCVGIYYLGPDPWFWEFRFKIEYHLILAPFPWVLCSCFLQYTFYVLTLFFENWDLRLDTIWLWLNIFFSPESCVWYFLGPNPRFWELRFEIEYHVIVGQYYPIALSLVFVLA